jgi:hypothetical protein
LTRPKIPIKKVLILSLLQKKSWRNPLTKIPSCQRPQIGPSLMDLLLPYSLPSHILVLLSLQSQHILIKTYSCSTLLSLCLMTVMFSLTTITHFSQVSRNLHPAMMPHHRTQKIQISALAVQCRASMSTLTMPVLPSETLAMQVLLFGDVRQCKS